MFFTRPIVCDQKQFKQCSSFSSSSPVTPRSHSALLPTIPLSPFSLVSSSRAYRFKLHLFSLWKACGGAASFSQFCLTLVKLPACAPSRRCKQANYANNGVANNSTRTSSHAGKKPLLVGYCEALAFVSRFPKLVSNKCSVPPILGALVLEAWYSVFEGSHESRVCYTVLN